MLSSRNIHFAVLGIILGAASGYILAFYQVQKSMPPPALSSGAGAAQQQGHPDVSTEQLLALFQQALSTSPNDPELLTRYAAFLFDIGRNTEAEKAVKRLEEVDPKYPGLEALRKRIP